MPRVFEFTFSSARLAGLRFLVCREDLPQNGDVETAFFEGIDDLQCHPAPCNLTGVLAEAVAKPATEVVIMIRNPGLVLVPEILDRILEGLDRLPDNTKWSIASGGGLGLGDTRYQAFYASEAPCIPTCGDPQPLLDVMPDLTIVNAKFAAGRLSTGTGRLDTALEAILAVEGYLEGHASIFLPNLIAGIVGPLLCRDHTRFEAELVHRLGERLSGQTLQTLAGPIELQTAKNSGLQGRLSEANLSKCIDTTLRQLSRPAALSVVTRTCFTRPHLLRRLLTSLSRARHAELPFEILIVTDVPCASSEHSFAELERDFPALDLRLVIADGDAPSRVRNLLSGIAAAQNDYVVLIDDDDYVDLLAFQNLEKAFFLGNRPIITTKTDVHREEWTAITSTKPVVARSDYQSSYAANGWRKLFDGVNKLPICAVLTPTKLLQQRLADVPFSYDLSEDYALFLLLFTTPDLPNVVELNSVFCHISLRDTENSVGMADRRPWARDIAGHLATLQNMPDGKVGPGAWSLLSHIGTSTAPRHAANQATELRNALQRKDKELKILRHELDYLRAQLSQKLEAAT